MRTENNANVSPAQFPMLTQCVRVTPLTDYFFGFKYKQVANANLVCIIEAFAGTNCTGGAGDVAGTTTIQGPQVPNPIDWTSIQPTEITPLVGTQSFLFLCQPNGLGAVNFDEFYLNASAALF